MICLIPAEGTGSLIVRPHAQHLDDAFLPEHLVHEAMLDIDTKHLDVRVEGTDRLMTVDRRG